MDVMRHGQKALSEYRSKQLLKQYGVPVVEEALAHSAEQAAALAKEVGFPVVLKACSPEITHKSEKGWVALDLRDEERVREAYRHLTRDPHLELEGVLVQEMIRGERELVLGMKRDPHFGPCVMLGLGGIFTEVLQDTAFRVAPVDRIEVWDMVEELRCRPLLGWFRGQEPADMELVAQALMGLGRLALERREVTEIDVNPVIIDRAGRPKAVDALVVLDGVTDA